MIFLDTSYINGLILNNDNYASLSRTMRPYMGFIDSLFFLNFTNF